MENIPEKIMVMGKGEVCQDRVNATLRVAAKIVSCEAHAPHLQLLRGWNVTSSQSPGEVNNDKRGSKHK